jgi:hypothetical protein
MPKLNDITNAISAGYDIDKNDIIELAKNMDVDDNKILVSTLDNVDKSLENYEKIKCLADKCEMIEPCGKSMIKSPRKISELDDSEKKIYKESEAKFKKIIENKSECAFDKEQSSICSPSEYIEVFKTLTGKSTGEEALKELKKITECETEKCVIDKKRADFQNVNVIIKEYFKPEGPEDRTKGWLSNSHIDDILEQFAKKHKDFYHIPFQMADIDRITYKSFDSSVDFYKINLLEKFMETKKSKFGVVFNTDPSNKNGQHWYCLYGYMDGKKVVLEYFNSAGDGPNDDIQLPIIAWLCKQKQYFIKNKYTCSVSFENNIRIQDNSHACGVYCIMYIYSRLEGVHNLWLANKENFNDEVMREARKIIFSYK